MNCRRAQSRLSEYIDGEVARAERLRVATHLAGCAVCRADEESLRSAKRLASLWGAYQPGPELQWRLDPAVLAARARASERMPWFSRLQAALIPAGATAAAAALLLAVGAIAPLLLSNRGDGRQPDVAVVDPSRLPVPSAVRAPRPIPPDAVVPAEPAEQGEVRVFVPAPAPDAAEPAAGVSSEAVPARRPARVRRPASRGAAHRHPARPVAEPSPAAAPVMEAPSPGKEEPRVKDAPEPIVVARTLYARGRYQEAVGVLNAAFERSSKRFPVEMRAVYQEQNSSADSDIAECSQALRDDPGNANARKFLEKAYDTKVAILRSPTS